MNASRPLVATERAALIMQLVPYLLERGDVALDDAARDFEVSPAQMRGMVEKLTVIGRPGEGGFWSLPGDLFDIDWDLLDTQDRIALTHTVGLERTPRLTAREAAALLAGLQLTGSLPGVSDSALLEGLLAKLARGAASAPADVIVAPAPVDHVRERVDEALRRGRAISFSYKTPDAAATTRTVDPVKVHIAEGQWYLQGWCHLRQATRTFHLDRVSDVEVTDIPVTHGADPLPALFDTLQGDIVARLRFPEAVAPLLGEFLTHAEIESSGGMATATVRLADEGVLRRLAARRAGDVEILAPEAARRAAASWAHAGLAQYEHSD
ncbi:YafY family protein [Microbacterium sp. CIAB417]|uniref:helix-turn-helix transcriptional regulator n=1 Tax=Microbacterium sp. CIAB417 TaxID=2860287 RepID=UPI001FAC2067|nr:WYL domain-containing protein [Microbacterium sp. CIAB417]